MPILKRLPPQEQQPAAWRLFIREDESDEAQHDALKEFLEPGGPLAGKLELDPSGDAQRIEFELCESCPLMKWRRKTKEVIHVRLQKVALKALCELWELVVQGAGEYSFEMLDLTEPPGAQTYLTISMDTDA